MVRKMFSKANWVHVKNALPTLDRTILFCDANTGEIFIGVRHEDSTSPSRGWLPDFSDTLVSGITHWAEKPKMPEKIYTIVVGDIWIGDEVTHIESAKEVW